MMGIISENKMESTVKNIIDELGLESTVRVIGNYDEVEPYLTLNDKIQYIKDKVTKINNGDSFSLDQIDEKTIPFDKKGDILHLIEKLHPERVSIMIVMGNEKQYQYVTTYRLTYEELPPHIIDTILKTIIDK